MSLRSDIILCGLMLGTCFSGMARADNMDEIEDIIITGSNIPYPQDLFPAAVQILDQTEIENRVSGNMTDLFRGLPGVDVVQLGGGRWYYIAADAGGRA